MEKPNYTQVPNVLLENLPKFTDAELRVMLCMCRQTFGWQRETTKKMSSSFLAQATGMSQQGVLNATKTLMKQKFISRVKDGLSFTYEVDLGSLPKPLNGVETQAIFTPQRRLDGTLNAVEGFALKPLNGVETNKEMDLKERKEQEAVASGSSLKLQLTDLWIREFKRANGMEYLFQGIKDGRAADRLIASGISPNEIIEIAQEAWKRPDGFNCKAAASLAGFSSRFNEIRMEVKSPSRSSKNQEKELFYDPSKF